MKSGDMILEMVETCLMHYPKKYIREELSQTNVSNLPLEKNSRPSTTTQFLFGLLRTVNTLNAPEACKAALEKMIASQLHQPTLDNLLIPICSYMNETLYDVECIEKILGYFLNSLN
ncbi:hypothetical protein ACFX15_008344 [Malus domestica]